MIGRLIRSVFGFATPPASASRARGASAWRVVLALAFTAATVALLPPVRGVVDPVYREG
jgi:hypothetical protein